MAGSDYRNRIYNDKFSGKKNIVTAKQILTFMNRTNQFLEHAIAVNKRNDDLYHTYNLISYDEQAVKISHLSEMLEGQVAVLSSGFLTAEQSLKLLDALKESSLYRPDQNSYILYPNKNLPKFLNKNIIPAQSAQESNLLKKLLADGDLSIIEKDINGDLHFNGNFRNANDVNAALKKLDQRYHQLVEQEKALILQIFEDVFRHKEFTGRSGTFFGYEGLGSIYWHMVSKLLLSVQETCLRAIADQADEKTIQRLIKHYYDINDGIGVHKPPQQYGAFPTDPYSHTPLGKGAQQPGMTGQVKEDIICRFGELGVFVTDGKLLFNPLLLRRNEFIIDGKQVDYINTNGEKETISLQKNALFFTYCQVPVVYVLSEQEGIELTNADGSGTMNTSSMLSENDSAAVFQRSGAVKLIKVFLNAATLRN
jgi:hypothetical protein